jgi:hypothetical protein
MPKQKKSDTALRREAMLVLSRGTNALMRGKVVKREANPEVDELLMATLGIPKPEPPKKGKKSGGKGKSARKDKPKDA